MSNQRILTKKLETGELMGLNSSTTLDEPILSSVGACWNDLLKLEHHFLPPMESPDVILLDHHLCMHFSNYPMVLEWQLNGERPGRKLVEPGNIHLSTRGAISRGSWQEPAEILSLYLDTAFVARVAQDLIYADQVEFTNPYAFQNPQLQYLMLALKAELEAGCPSGRLFGESLGTALAIQMLKHYGVHSPTIREYKGGLPPYKLKRVIAYINNHLSEDVSLAAIAAEVGISQYYFSRLFKQSLGMPPHKYINQQRIERAKQLLKDPKLAIADIALQCGYFDHSHFTKFFRRFTGVTPKVYRDK